jgi:pyruvate dehydrogenase phosphatase
MQLRSFSAALVAAGAVAGGAYYYRGQTPLRADASRGGERYEGLDVSWLPKGSETAKSALADPAQTTRRALVVEQGQIYTGTIVGNEPLAKEPDDNGRNVLETQKLRRNEDSWMIHRGAGVVRYDLVQIPSNNPIEDDHVEKIIQVPDTVAATGDETKNNTDWMFWGVFDGHR